MQLQQDDGEPLSPNSMFLVTKTRMGSFLSLNTQSKQRAKAERQRQDERVRSKERRLGAIKDALDSAITGEGDTSQSETSLRSIEQSVSPSTPTTETISSQSYHSGETQRHQRYRRRGGCTAYNVKSPLFIGDEKNQPSSFCSPSGTNAKRLSRNSRKGFSGLPKRHSSAPRLRMSSPPSSPMNQTVDKLPIPRVRKLEAPVTVTVLSRRKVKLNLPSSPGKGLDDDRSLHTIDQLPVPFRQQGSMRSLRDIDDSVHTVDERPIPKLVSKNAGSSSKARLCLTDPYQKKKLRVPTQLPFAPALDSDASEELKKSSVPPRRNHFPPLSKKVTKSSEGPRRASSAQDVLARSKDPNEGSTTSTPRRRQKSAVLLSRRSPSKRSSKLPTRHLSHGSLTHPESPESFASPDESRNTSKGKSTRKSTGGMTLPMALPFSAESANIRTSPRKASRPRRNKSVPSLPPRAPGSQREGLKDDAIETPVSMKGQRSNSLADFIERSSDSKSRNNDSFNGGSHHSGTLTCPHSTGSYMRRKSVTRYSLELRSPGSLVVNHA